MNRPGQSSDGIDAVGASAEIDPKRTFAMTRWSTMN